MSKVDWSKAPEGATHKDYTAHGLWYKFDIERDQVSYWFHDHWSPSGEPENYNDGSLDHMEERPKPAWSGPQDGLPPVGSTVEVFECTHDYTKRFNGQKVRILCHENDVAVFSAKNFEYHALVKDKFRPIRTPDQLAAEQRETAIADMANVLPGANYECYSFNDDGSVKPYQRVRMILELLVDAGFKREVV